MQWNPPKEIYHITQNGKAHISIEDSDYDADEGGMVIVWPYIDVSIVRELANALERIVEHSTKYFEETWDGTDNPLTQANEALTIWKERGV